MQWEELDEQYQIKQTACQTHNGECVITWSWPKGVESVFIYSFPEGAEQPPESLQPKQLKLFTREEYRARSGYRDRAEFLGVQGYRIFPCVMQGGRLAAMMQTDEHNVARASGGKAKIRYRIKYGQSWFSKYKTARIQLFCEIAVPKEALCYVKKEGAAPAGRDDGIVYPFMNDLAPGSHVLPEVEIGKRDYIRLFFTDGKSFGSLFELIPE
ncbi:hypothetical protein [Paenibacillus piri]|uniref:Beta-mannanase n=1 Tax=Paenibacillus piri TaxID=2547395 RepID=A0A4R5KGD9_9BACL|nr:hypothetical protein [Paenibacillus piri]TDF94082.1 hypothetical protein E1757_24620 [Paenibacillus piri]